MMNKKERKMNFFNCLFLIILILLLLLLYKDEIHKILFELFVFFFQKVISSVFSSPILIIRI